MRWSDPTCFTGHRALAYNPAEIPTEPRLGRSRRLAKDYERRLQSAEAFIKLSMIHLMLRRLA